MNTVIVKAPAKINLTLDITGKRDDGYHLMDMVMQTVDLYDTLTLTKDVEISLTCDRDEVPDDDKNIAWRAAEAFFERTGITRGVDIHINKVIPMQAGLAGGSADAAGVLCGLNVLYDTKLTTEELCEIGLKIGADVPFCITGATALTEGIGEIISPIASMPQCTIIIAKPAVGMSTAEAFKRFDDTAVHKHPDNASVVSAIAEGNLEAMAGGMYNVLEEVSEISEVAEIEKEMIAHGAVKAMMTGSGTGVFGIFDNRSNAKKCLKNLMGKASCVFLSSPVNHGPIVFSDDVEHNL